jgi:hypothetical protein
VYCGCECDGVKSVETWGASQLYIGHSKSCMHANQDAPECVNDGILSYGSDMSQELGLPLICEHISRLALDPSRHPILTSKSDLGRMY